MEQHWVCVAGKSFLGQTGDDLHLFFVLTNPMKLPSYGNQSQVLSVNISSVYEDRPYDNTCEINVGEHPFINRRSYVYYRRMRLDTAVHIENLVNSGVFLARENCTPELLQRILQGALNSIHTPKEFKQIIRNYLT